MNYLYSIAMGIIQGLTEFLPVSSSGHLVIFQMLFGEASGSNLFFEVLLHLGTLVAVVVAFWKDLWGMLTDFIKLIGRIFTGKKEPMTDNLHFIILLIMSLIPLIIVLPIKSLIESVFSTPLIIGITLIMTSSILFIADLLPAGTKECKNATWKDALFVGFMQLIAVTPGLSRSGTTITAGIFRGYTRDFAVRFSFIMSIPTVLAAFVLELMDSYKTIDVALAGQYFVGFIVSAVVGYAAIKLVRYVASKGNFKIFAIYCACAGLFTIIWSTFVQ